MLALGLLAGLAVTASARTILLDVRDADRMAAMDESAPRQSWAASAQQGGDAAVTFYSTGLVLTSSRSFLIRYSLSRIPAGQRVAHAELLVPLSSYSGTDPRFYLWRVLAEWGLGVSYQYRIAWPDKRPWTRPGARGISSDRATRPTDILRLTAAGELAINVTEDVDLWHRGAAPNHGWLFTVEDPGTSVQFRSPAWDPGESWRLRITYEPEDGE